MLTELSFVRRREVPLTVGVAIPQPSRRATVSTAVQHAVPHEVGIGIAGFDGRGAVTIIAVFLRVVQEEESPMRTDPPMLGVSPRRSRMRPEFPGAVPSSQPSPSSGDAPFAGNAAGRTRGEPQTLGGVSDRKYRADTGSDLWRVSARPVPSHAIRSVLTPFSRNLWTGLNDEVANTLDSST